MRRRHERHRFRKQPPHLSRIVAHRETPEEEVVEVPGDHRLVADLDAVAAAAARWLARIVGT